MTLGYYYYIINSLLSFLYPQVLTITDLHYNSFDNIYTGCTTRVSALDLLTNFNN